MTRKIRHTGTVDDMVTSCPPGGQYLILDTIKISRFDWEPEHQNPNSEDLYWWQSKMRRRSEARPSAQQLQTLLTNFTFQQNKIKSISKMNALTATIPRVARLSAARYASTSAGPSFLPVSSLYGKPILQ